MRAASNPPPVPGDVLHDLLPIVREINEILDPVALLPAIAQKVRWIVDYTALDIFLPEPDGTLVPGHVEGYADGFPAGMRLKPGQGIVGTAAQLREPVFSPDVKNDPRYISVLPGVVAELAIPLIHRDRLVGVLNVDCADAAAFSSEAITALRLLASHLAVAIDNASLYRETRWYAGLLATLYEIGKETASILDLDALLSRVTEIVKRVIDYEMFAIHLLDEDTQSLVVKKAVGFGPFKGKPPLQVGQGLVGQAVLRKEPVLVGDVRQDPHYIDWVPEARSELVVPMIHKDRVLGAFDLESSVLNRFTEEHVKVLTPLASQVAVAVDNARLYDELRKRDERVRKELAIARNIQHGLFPEECPSGPGWEASAHFRPARELGGDLYDFYEVADGQLGLALGDVSGKGVPAALFGAFVSGTVRARAFERRAPADLLERVNRTLRRRSVEGLFCALSFGLIDLATRTLRVASSGLPYPLRYQAATGTCQAIELAGLPLGLFDDSKYDEVSAALAPNDVLIFHTDGISEAHNGREAFGLARLRTSVEASAHLSTPRIGDHILSTLDGFMGDAQPQDDVTLLVVKVK